MKNILTIKPGREGTSVEIAIGNAGGGHAMILGYGELVKIREWIDGYRADVGVKPLSIPQGGKPE